MLAVNRTETPWVVAAVHRPLYSSCANFKEQQSMRNGFSALFARHAVDVVLYGHVHSYERTWSVAVSLKPGKPFLPRICSRVHCWVASSPTSSSYFVSPLNQHGGRSNPPVTSRCGCLLHCPLLHADVRSSDDVTAFGRPVTGDYSNTSNATVQSDAGITLDRYVNPKSPVHVVAGTAGNGESIDDCSKDAARYNFTFSAVRSNDIGYGRLRARNASHLEVGFYSVSQSKQLDHFWIERK